MKIFNKDFIIDLQKTILWQYDKASKLRSLIDQKQAWYKINVTDFIANFFVNIFNLKTANDFGLSVWGRILNFPRQIFLNKYQITAEQTEGTDLTDIEVSRTVFNAKIESGDDFTAVTIKEEEFKKIIFTYDGSNWNISGSVTASDVDITDYGITFTGTPAKDDTITVTCDWTALNLTTEQYRFLLLGQVLKFRMNCTLPEINRYLRLIFNQKDNSNVYVTDNHNMTIIYTIQPPVLDSDIQKLVNNYDFLPAPAGVLATTTATNYVTITFIRNSNDYIYTVTIDGTVYQIDTELEQSITVPYGSTVNWSTTSQTAIVQQSGRFTAIEDTTITTTCYKLTVRAWPQTATITFTANGQTYNPEQTIVSGSYTEGQIIAPSNTSVTYTVELEGYVAESATVVMNQNRTYYFDLQKEKIEGTVKTNDYPSYPVYTLKETTIIKTGIYRIILKGEQGNRSISTPGGTQYTKQGKGGIVICDFALNQNQVVKFQRIRGGRVSYQGYRTNIACGGAGVGFLIGNTLKLVAGGGGSYAQFSAGADYFKIGGGGKIGGAGNSYSGYEGNGYSADGTLGNNTSIDTNSPQGENYVISGNTCNGGTGYIETGLTPSTVQYGSNLGDGYYSIEYIG